MQYVSTQIYGHFLGILRNSRIENIHGRKLNFGKFITLLSVGYFGIFGGFEKLLFFIKASKCHIDEKALYRDVKRECICALLQFARYGNVTIDCSQLSAKQCQIFVFDELIPELFRKLIQMLVNALQIAETRQQIQRRLFADTRHSRNVVAAVSRQSFVFYDLLRRISEKFLYIVLCAHLYFGKPFFGQIYFRVVVYKLQAVAVAGKHYALYRKAPRHCAYYVVRLISLQLENTYPHKAQHFFQDGQLAGKIVGHLLSAGFVLGINFMTERRRVHIKRHGYIIGFIVAYRLYKHCSKTVDRIYRFALGIVKRRQSVICSVYKTITVY